MGRPEVKTVSTEKQDLLDRFLIEMVSKIGQRHGNEIMSITLFGSAATREWIKGKSDIDFAVIIKNSKLSKSIDDSINSILLKLDKEHNLGLSRTCSTYEEHKNPIISLFLKIESLLTFGRPFLVFSMDQINFKTGKIKNSRMRILSIVFDPIKIFFAKIGYTGITIYGEDLIGKIRFSASPIEKVRIAIAPLWVLSVGFFSFPFDASFALKHSIKAVFWACEDALFALDLPLSSYKEEANMMSAIFSKDKGLISHLEETTKLRFEKNQEIPISKGFIAKHLIETFIFIAFLYYRTANSLGKKYKFT
jgi:predicted nucleotidyltransferase